MNMPNKFIEILSDEDHRKLLESYQTSENFRIRNRANAILLSYQRYSVDEIAAICRVHRTAVSRWMERWNELGIDGLADLPRDGRPPILTEQEQEAAVATAMKNPKFPHRQLGRIKAETGKEISKYTLKNLLKKRLCLEENKVGVVEASE
jgi:transposase